MKECRNLTVRHFKCSNVLAWRSLLVTETSRLWAYYNCDTSTIRVGPTIRVRFERDTTSYEELCAFEQHVNSFAML